MKNFKKSLSLLMCLLMVLSVMSMSVSARNKVDFNISCSRLDQLMTGDSILKVSDFTLPSADYVVEKVVCRDNKTNNLMGATDSFLGGNSYTIGILVSGKSPSITQAEFDGINVMVNRKAVNVVLQDGKLAVTFDITIDKFMVPAFAVTTEGYNPGKEVQDFKIETNTIGLYLKEYAFWNIDEKRYLLGDESFEPGKNYRLYIDFYLTEGFDVPEDLDINEIAFDIPCNEKELVYVGTDEIGKYIVLGYTLKTPVHYDSVVIGLSGYGYGEEVGDISVSHGLPGVSFKGGYVYGTSYCIIKEDAEGNKEVISDEATIFEYDTKYYLSVKLEARDGCDFKNLTKTGISLRDYNGEITLEDKTDYSVTIYFKLPELVSHKCAENLTIVQGYAAECKKDGLISHYKCTCGKEYFDDKATSLITDANDKVISALGHKFGFSTPACEPSCDKEGFKEGFRVCRSCNKKFRLDDDTTPFTDEEFEVLKIPAKGHTGGEATCKAVAVCTVCYAPYGEINVNNHKNLVVIPAVEATCLGEGLTEGRKCADCGEIVVIQQKVASKGHYFEAVPAVEPTYEKEGLTEGERCTVCGEINIVQKPVPKKTLGKVEDLKVKTVKLGTGTKTSLTLAWTKVADAEKYEVQQYVNKKWKTVKTVKKASLTVKKLKANKSYKFRVRAIRSDAEGAYTTLTAKTVPLKTALTLKSGSKRLTASWKTVANINGYELAYSTAKKFTKKTTKTVVIKKAKTKKTTIKSLKKGKKYFVRVRAYKTVGGKNIYSAWSAVKNVKVK